MCVWLFLLLSWIALLSPSKPEPFFSLDEDEALLGLATDYPLHVVFGAITAVYYLSLVPMLILPIKDDERFEWFYYSALAWVICLISTLLALTISGLVGYVDVKLPVSPRGMAGIAAVIFVTAMLLMMFVRVGSHRRLFGLFALLGGWFFLQGSLLVLWRLADTWMLPKIFTPEFRGTQGLAFLMLSLLWIFLICSQTLAQPAQRGDVLGFLVLAWLFFVAAILCYEMTHEQIQILGGDGWAVFLCIVISTFVAPYASWLGVPGNRHRRFAWLICMIFAALTVLAAATWLEIPDGAGGLLRQVWSTYDGPRLDPG